MPIGEHFTVAAAPRQGQQLRRFHDANGRLRRMMETQISAAYAHMCYRFDFFTSDIITISGCLMVRYFRWHSRKVWLILVAIIRNFLDALRSHFPARLALISRRSRPLYFMR